MFHESKVTYPKTLYMVLSCVFYYPLDNYVCIDYLLCQSKTLINISSNIIFEQTSFNILLGISIPEVLLNLVSCHGFVEKPNITVILNVLSRLVNDYLAKGFFIIENNFNQLSILLNDVKLRICVIEQLEKYFVMAKNTEILSVANTTS